MILRGSIPASLATSIVVLSSCASKPPVTTSEPQPPSQPTEAVAVSPPPTVTPQETPTPPAPAVATAVLTELFPSVRADITGRLIELDGIVPINCHDPATPDVYLELMVCSPDTREHESLVMTRAKPSHLHAALLAIGLKPGQPGSWKVEAGKLVPLPPTGDPLAITASYRATDGSEVTCPIADWVITAETHQPFVPRDAFAPRWLFAGSVFVTRRGNEVYDADGAGTVIGLTTFGSEVVAWRDTISPEASIDTPDWIADAKKVPPAGTPVIVRIRPVTASP
jgi:hypothetical protein